MYDQRKQWISDRCTQTLRPSTPLATLTLHYSALTSISFHSASRMKTCIFHQLLELAPLQGFDLHDCSPLLILENRTRSAQSIVASQSPDVDVGTDQLHRCRPTGQTASTEWAILNQGIRYRSSSPANVRSLLDLPKFCQPLCPD